MFLKRFKKWGIIYLFKVYQQQQQQQKFDEWVDLIQLYILGAHLDLELVYIYIYFLKNQFEQEKKMLNYK